jgi:pilus assembly protein Flp/PilA
LPKKSALNLRDYYTVLTRTFSGLALVSRFALLVIPASDTILLRYFEISLNFPQVSWVKTEKIQNIQGRKPMMSEFIKYLKDEDGQTSTEYILLVAVVAMVIFKFKDELNSRLTGLIEKVFGKADTIVEGL